jgi:hypothetical protein
VGEGEGVKWITVDIINTVFAYVDMKNSRIGSKIDFVDDILGYRSSV